MIVRFLLAVFSLLAAGSISRAADPAKQEFFESRIRPVLIEHCYECHNSADANEGDLAVDHRQAFIDGGSGGAIIVPSDASKSRLMAILRHEVDGLEMPETGPKLDDTVIADFQTWINDGAFDPRDQPPSAEELSAATSWEAVLERRKKWWSFQPIQHVEPPVMKDVQHPIDRFVRSRSPQAVLVNASPAEPAVLVRRLYFNLIGLPPTIDEATKWTQRITNAVDRETSVNELIDVLIDSPRFGERWARHWMDWIRYAESHGSEGDPRIDNAWLYRDYLIRAINADVPYDQLVREHIAGDLLEKPRVNEALGINESMIGTAHWRMVFHGFAPTDALDERVRFTDDQINTFSKAFLGLTVSCARCHDHKFDAISQADYYALFGVFASCRPARKVIDLPAKQNTNREQLSKLKSDIREALANDWLATIGDIGKRIDLHKDYPPTSILHPIKKLRDRTTPVAFRDSWNKLATPMSHESAKPVQQWDLSSRADYAEWFHYGNGLGERPDVAGNFAIATDDDRAVLAIYPAGVYSHGLSSKHAARLTSGDFGFGQGNELWVQAIGDGESTLRYVVHDYPRNGTVYPVTKLSNQWTWQKYDVNYWNDELAHIELTTGKDAPLLTKNEDRSWFGVRRAILQPIGSPSPENKQEALQPLFSAAESIHSMDQLVAHYQTVAMQCVQAWRDETISDSQALFLDQCVSERLLDNKIANLPTAGPLLRRYRERESEVPVPTRVPGLDETDAADWPLYIRGDHKSPSDRVPRRFLEAIDAAPFDDQHSGRLELAEKLLANNNPLTRRVIVNRIWHHLFGRGIVGTPDNFGRMGLEPTHPELLDYLADQFQENGWSMKQLIRQIVRTQTWQQSSRPVGLAGLRDPENKWLSHANVRRLEAEAIRDSILSVAGSLDHQLYGAPVDFQQPRRSVYMKVVRNSLDPFLRVFDFPEPFSSTGRRDATNVPAQSLTLLNDSFIRKQSVGWAEKTATFDSLQERTNQMFFAAFARPATTAEVDHVRRHFERSKQRLADYQASADALNKQLADLQHQLATILDPARSRISERQNATERIAPKPTSSWDFAQGIEDLIGDNDCELHAGATVGEAGLELDGKGYATTSPLSLDVHAKTLEAWVQLATLDQAGGGVMTIQTRSGSVFDSIVFAETQSLRWLAGSDHHTRYQSFDGPAEAAALAEPVHLAIVYHADGRITGYRNGVPYGKEYQSKGIVDIKAGDATISFGLRHLPAGGNRLLKGRVLKANFYARALDAKEIAASSGNHRFVSFDQVLASLTPSQRDRAERLRAEIAHVESKLQALGPRPPQTDRERWQDLAQALFTLKEFIYIR
ncbi:MAG: DUF1553 domain-containing protein [Pirellulaceae bacterium]